MSSGYRGAATMAGSKMGAGGTGAEGTQGAGGAEMEVCPEGTGVPNWPTSGLVPATAFGSAASEATLLRGAEGSEGVGEGCALSLRCRGAGMDRSRVGGPGLSLACRGAAEAGGKAPAGHHLHVGGSSHATAGARAPAGHQRAHAAIPAQRRRDSHAPRTDMAMRTRPIVPSTRNIRERRRFAALVASGRLY